MNFDQSTERTKSQMQDRKDKIQMVNSRNTAEPHDNTQDHIQIINSQYQYSAYVQDGSAESNHTSTFDPHSSPKRKQSQINQNRKVESPLKLINSPRKL